MSDSVNRMLNAFSGISKESTSSMKSELFHGTVSSVNHLVITYEVAESRVPLTEGFLTLSKTCKPLSIVVDGKMVSVWGGLSVGERVILLSFNNGQRFFVERAD